MYEGLLRDEIPQEHKDRIEMASKLLRRSRILVVCGDSMDGQVKDDIGLAKRLRIAAVITHERIYSSHARIVCDCYST